MKILLIHGAKFLRALQALGHDVYLARPESAHDLCDDDNDFTIHEVVHRAGFEPDLILVELFGAKPLIGGLESCPFPLVAYCFDSCFNHFWLSHYLKLFDLVFVDFKDSLSRLARDGISAHWLPFSIDPESFAGDPVRKEHDIGFVGVTESRPRRRALFEILRREFDVVVAGASDHDADSDLRLSFKQTADLYRRCRIVINENLYDGVNFRVFEGMASGSLLLTEATDNGLGDLFEPGVHLATYTSESLLDQIVHYLSDEDARESIAAAGRDRVLEKHSNLARARQILRTAEGLTGALRSRDAARRSLESATARYLVCRRWPNYIDREFSQIESLLSIALNSHIDNGRALWTSGLLHGEWGDEKKALADLEEASQSLPHEPLLAMHQVHLLQKLGYQEPALEAARRVARLAVSASVDIAHAMREALTDFPLGARLWFQFGRLLEARGQGVHDHAVPLKRSLFPRYAVEYYQRAYEGGFGSPALIAMGRCYARHKILNVAYDAFMRAVEEEPANAEALFLAGVMSLKMFRRQEGLNLLREAVAVDAAFRPRLASLALRPDERALLG